MSANDVETAMVLIPFWFWWPVNGSGTAQVPGGVRRT
jgi:hypothetical protein